MVDSRDPFLEASPEGTGGPEVSVVIPAFNEEKSIGLVLRRTHEVLQKVRFPYEVIVIDDGSKDQTARVAEDHDVTLINHLENSGKGHALRRGFSKARGRFVVTLDADGAHQPEDIPRLLDVAFSSGAAVVIGSRFSGQLGEGAVSRLHVIGNRIINAVLLLMTGRYISDSQSGFRVYRREALERLSLYSSGYDIETELAVKLLKQGLPVEEVPITCDARHSGHSKVQTFKDGAKILKSILRAYFF